MSAYIRIIKPLNCKFIKPTEDNFYDNWDDGKEHEELNYSYISSCLKYYKCKKRILNILKKFNCTWYTYYYPIFHSSETFTPIKETIYYQGFNFKKNLLKRKMPIYFTSNKLTMIKFLQHNLNGNNKYNIIQSFSNAWENGCIFEFCY